MLIFNVFEGGKSNEIVTKYSRIRPFLTNRFSICINDISFIFVMSNQILIEMLKYKKYGDHNNEHVAVLEIHNKCDIWTDPIRNGAYWCCSRFSFVGAPDENIKLTFERSMNIIKLFYHLNVCLFITTSCFHWHIINFAIFFPTPTMET